MHAISALPCFRDVVASSVPAYLVNHSESYTIAAVSAWIEYWVESAVFGPKNMLAVSLVGLGLMLIGQVGGVTFSALI